MSPPPTISPGWATTSGDAWARRWPELDRGLAGVAERLDAAILAAAPAGPFRALDIGCGAGSTSLVLAKARADATIIACDLSPSLVSIATDRLAGLSVEVMLGDAAAISCEQGPFDGIFSRHGVMFFADPERAFRNFRNAAKPGARLVFTCFDDWAANHWASQLASAAAGMPVDPPGREPGGFAFADPSHVRSTLESAGWSAAEPKSIKFRYVVGRGATAIAEAMSLLCSVGPASVVLRDLNGPDKNCAVQRMGEVIERHFDGDTVQFPAAAWLWSARAGA